MIDKDGIEIEGPNAIMEESSKDNKANLINQIYYFLIKR